MCLRRGRVAGGVGNDEVWFALRTGGSVAITISSEVQQKLRQHPLTLIFILNVEQLP